MAAPIIAQTVRRGRKLVEVYRQGGRFVSKAKYQLQQRRDPFTGQFISKSLASRNEAIEKALRAKWGAPPAGKTWQQIAGKYPERFLDYLDDIQL